MPEKEIAERGGAMRYRTLSIRGKDGKKKYIHLAIVRKSGPRGGRSIAGPEHTVREK